MPGLGTSFGRGGATTTQQDLANADCILIQGSSMAEAHPVGFRWVLAAQERGATVIHVDPRYSRTSALSDIWVPLRAGSDIAFLGGIVRYVLENELYFKEYVVHYTNAAVILRDDFRDTEDLDGLFSGYDQAERRYEEASWSYDADDLSRPKLDRTLQHPRCVFQILRRHFSRYTADVVESLTGVPKHLLERVAATMAAASGPERTAAICYAVGWTQHSKGVQIIRTAAILQLLLGNIGRPGGGILALRGHASIQGSTDIPTLYDILPGYLPMPRAIAENDTLDAYVKMYEKRGGMWAELRSYIVSLMKAYYGRRATAENDWGFGYLPRLSRDHSHFSYFTEMMDGRVEGLFVFGQNPAVGSPHGRFERRALSKLRWLCVRDMVETETAAFWYNSPEVARGELSPDRIDTEVFLFPAASHVEKQGAFTNTQRLLQWRDKAVDPPKDARSDAWFVHQLAKRLIKRAQTSSDPVDEPLVALDWWYPENEHGEPEMQAVLAEINGFETSSRDTDGGVAFELGRNGERHHGQQLGTFHELRSDGSSACGCWIYCGVLGPDLVNRARRRKAEGPYAHGWGFAWPNDRRILYNRASARPDGRPWSDRKKLVWWDDSKKVWTGHDVPDFPSGKPPDYQPRAGARGLDALPGDAPFVMHDDGLGWLFVPVGLKDGPLPTHYEPLESPVESQLYAQQTNPVARWFRRADNPFSPPRHPRFPYVLTTYRLTEHHTAGGMSRQLSHLSELQPQMFVEISPELASKLDVENGDWVIVATIRGAIETRVLVTRRMRPLYLEADVIHQVAMPFHFGSLGQVRGGSANDLIAISGEPNVTIQESKALTCTVLKGRLPQEKDYVAWFTELTSGVSHSPPEGPIEDGQQRDSGHGEEGQI